jgi:hypothetical protein
MPQKGSLRDARVGVMTAARPGTFALTPLAALLRTGTPEHPAGIFKEKMT